ncbi:MAG: hypothetical protein ABW032_05850 [Burkholderiaceae bacterium]
MPSTEAAPLVGQLHDSPSLPISDPSEPTADGVAKSSSKPAGGRLEDLKSRGAYKKSRKAYFETGEIDFEEVEKLKTNAKTRKALQKVTQSIGKKQFIAKLKHSIDENRVDQETKDRAEALIAKCPIKTLEQAKEALAELTSPLQTMADKQSLLDELRAHVPQDSQPGAEVALQNGKLDYYSCKFLADAMMPPSLKSMNAMNVRHREARLQAEDARLRIAARHAPLMRVHRNTAVNVNHEGLPTEYQIPFGVALISFVSMLIPYPVQGGVVFLAEHARQRNRTGREIWNAQLAMLEVAFRNMGNSIYELLERTARSNLTASNGIAAIQSAQQMANTFNQMMTGLNLNALLGYRETTEQRRRQPIPDTYINRLAIEGVSFLLACAPLISIYANSGAQPVASPDAGNHPQDPSHAPADTTAVLLSLMALFLIEKFVPNRRG